MHLHGLYYRVDSFLDPRLDSSRDGAESDRLPAECRQLLPALPGGHEYDVTDH